MELQAQQHLVPVSPHSAAGSVYPAYGALQSSPLPVYLVYYDVYHHTLLRGQFILLMGLSSHHHFRYTWCIMMCITVSVSLHEIHCVVLGSSWRLYDQALAMLVYHSVRTWFKTGCELVFPLLLH